MPKLSELKKGDIFKFGDKSWDFPRRFHSLKIYLDGRYFINFMGIGYQGDIDKAFGNGSFTWRDNDEIVWLPEFYLSEQRKTKGKPCLPFKDQRQIYPSNLNECNLSNVFCEGKEYMNDYYSLTK